MRRTLSLCRLLAAVVCSAAPASAMIQHPDVDVLTYCDFGQNCGRFSVYNQNALQALRAEEGVQLTYQGGQAPYTLQHPVISFESQGDNGAFAAIAPNAIATVQHNGVQNPTFTARYLGEERSLHYNGVEFRKSDAFLLAADTDFKVTRLNKLITDVTPAVPVAGPGLAEADALLTYRSGAGRMTKVVNRETGEQEDLAEPYTYITGGITIMQTRYKTNWVPASEREGDDSCGAMTAEDWEPRGVCELAPLPFAGHEGDSGSPAWVWNSANNRYEYVGCLQGIDPKGIVYYTAAPAWSAAVLEQFTKTVTLAEGQNAALNPAKHDTGRSIKDEENSTAAHPYEGSVTVGDTEVTRFVGLKEGTEYWKPLNDVADKADWFAYDPAKYTSDKVKTADLFLTENLRFCGAGNHVITVEKPVEMGIGYVQVQGGDFTVTGDGRLNTAGYIVDGGATLTLELTNSSLSYLREWRKVGAGTLCIAGTGDNEVNLMLGGAGETRLQRRSGYAARNIHAASGARVVLDGRDQVRGNVVLGSGGATLDLNGHSIELGRDFTLTPLTQDATITNTKGSATLTLLLEQLEKAGFGESLVVAASEEMVQKPSKKKKKTEDAEDAPLPPAAAQRPEEVVEHPYLASFTDAPGCPLQVVLREDRDLTTFTPKRIVLSPTHTFLSQNGSGLVVVGGHVELRGLPTVHGMGSADGKSAARATRENDWHYADAVTPVLVGGHGRFTLGSHARLTGSVTVKSGCCFTMEQPVNAAKEYIEGSAEPEDTAAIADFVGLKGNVTLEEDAEMVIDGALESAFSYDGRIDGPEAELRIQSHGTVCLSNAESHIGHVWVSCERLENTPLHAREADIIANKPSAAAMREEDGKKILSLCCGTMQGGSVEAETLAITFTELEGADEADVLEVSLGADATPVQLSGIKEIEVIWGASRNALNMCKGALSERNGRTVIRVELKKAE